MYAICQDPFFTCVLCYYCVICRCKIHRSGGCNGHHRGRARHMAGKRRDASGIILSDFYVQSSSHQCQLFRREPYVDEEQWCTIWLARRHLLLSYVAVQRVCLYASCVCSWMGYDHRKLLQAVPFGHSMRLSQQ